MTQLVQITLNPQVQPMFMLPEGKLHLTFEDPGPVEIDAEKLSSQEKAWINQAYKMGTLKVVKLDENGEEKKPKQFTPEELIEQTKQAVAAVSPYKHLKEDEIKQVLKANVSAVKQKIKNTDDLYLIRAMKEYEVRDKNRATVLKEIEARQKQLHAELQTNLQHKPNGDKIYAGFKDPETGEEVTIDEVVEDEVTINLPQKK